MEYKYHCAFKTHYHLYKNADEKVFFKSQNVNGLSSWSHNLNSLLPYNFILMQYIFAVTFFLLVTLLYFKIKVMYINLIFKKFLLPLRPLSVNYFLDLAITIVISTQLVKAILENNY